MTNSEAIKILTEAGFGINIWNTPTGYCEEDWDEALDMAIEALSNYQNQTVSEVKTNTNSVSATDVIYRRDAIEELRDIIVKDVQFGDELTDGYNDGIDMAITVISKLPSAHPEIIRCKDCKWWDKSEDSLFGYCMAMKHGYMSANWEIGIYRRYRDDSMQNCHDMRICCEDETGLCDYFEEIDREAESEDKE